MSFSLDLYKYQRSKSQAFLDVLLIAKPLLSVGGFWLKHQWLPSGDYLFADGSGWRVLKELTTTLKDFLKTTDETSLSKASENWHLWGYGMW